MTFYAGPVATGERMGSLDILRGVAVCGILLMNIPWMGMVGLSSRPPMPAVPNLDWIAYSIQDSLFMGTMRGLFTLLFGAGMLIMLRRADEAGGEESIQSYLTRCFALMLLGVANFAIFLWPGEILFTYGVVGIALLLFRKARTRVLLMATAAIIFASVLDSTTPVLDRAAVLRDAPAAEAARAEGKTLTKAQEATLATYATMTESLRPPPAKLEQERAQRTSFPGVLVWSTKLWTMFNFTEHLLAWWGQCLAFMLLGMALFRSGVLTGAKSLKYYATMAVAGYGLGLAIRGGVKVAQWSTGFELNPEVMLWRSWTNEPARLATTVGLVGFVMVLFKVGAFGRLAGGIKAIGRMALTNYVAQSAITSILFYGFGTLGKFGFAQLMGIAALIWIVQGVFSLLWLKRYQMGPLEWGLRQLTYGRWTSLGRTAAPNTAPTAVPAE
jgi:uncharacterized protein